MIFANEISEIVHSVCDSFDGAANKNLGDCFLMVWKFKDDFIKLKEETDEIEVKNLKVLQNYTDQALFALLKTLSASYKIQHRDPMKKLIKEIKD